MLHDKRFQQLVFSHGEKTGEEARGETEARTAPNQAEVSDAASTPAHRLLRELATFSRADLSLDRPRQQLSHKSQYLSFLTRTAGN